MYAFSPVDGSDNYHCGRSLTSGKGLHWRIVVVNGSAAETGGVRHVRFVTDRGLLGSTSRRWGAGRRRASRAWQAPPPTWQGQGFRPQRPQVPRLGGRLRLLRRRDGVSGRSGPGRTTRTTGTGSSGDDRPHRPRLLGQSCDGSAEAHEFDPPFSAASQPTAPHGYLETTTAGDQVGATLLRRRLHRVTDCGIARKKELVPLTYPCAKSYERLLDCNHDDYFSTSPSPDSWLGQHWNVADSSFLTSEGPASVPDSSAPRPTAPKPRLEGQLTRSAPVPLRWGEGRRRGRLLALEERGRAAWRYVPRRTSG